MKINETKYKMWCIFNPSLFFVDIGFSISFILLILAIIAIPITMIMKIEMPGILIGISILIPLVLMILSYINCLMKLFKSENIKTLWYYNSNMNYSCYLKKDIEVSSYSSYRSFDINKNLKQALSPFYKKFDKIYKNAYLSKQTYAEYEDVVGHLAFADKYEEKIFKKKYQLFEMIVDVTLVHFNDEEKRKYVNNFRIETPEIIRYFDFDNKYKADIERFNEEKSKESEEESKNNTDIVSESISVDNRGVNETKNMPASEDIHRKPVIKSVKKEMNKPSMEQGVTMQGKLENNSLDKMLIFTDDMSFDVDVFKSEVKLNNIQFIRKYSKKRFEEVRKNKSAKYFGGFIIYDKTKIMCHIGTSRDILGRVQACFMKEDRRIFIENTDDDFEVVLIGIARDKDMSVSEQNDLLRNVELKMFNYFNKYAPYNYVDTSTVI